MAYRTKLILLAAFTSLVVVSAGCGYPQPSRFQMAFLPASPAPLVATVLAPPPMLEPNPFIKDVPAIIQSTPAVPPFQSRATGLMQRAEQRMQRARRLYQAQDTDRARAEFDSAVDLMLQAGDYPMADRGAWEQKLEGMVETIHRYDLAGLGAAVNLEDQRFDKAPLEDILQMTFPVDPKLKTKVREQALATASQLPLSINDSVLGYIHYFNGRGRKTLLAGFQRAGRYRPMIQRILDEEGVPQELIYLAQAESGFFPRAVSRKAATGMWQFVAFRGQQYGLMQTRYTDDRLDPEKATRAAARHLRDLYHQFGDWYLAIAAYNCGPGAVERAVERTGYADFWALRDRRVLPAETTNYVPIILAMTIMAKNAPEYGLDNIAADPALGYETVEVAVPTHLALVADLIDASVTEVAQLNPAVLKGVAPAGYALHVPKGTAQPMEAALKLIPAERRASWRMHKIAGGDTLASIGKRYNTSPGTIAAANPALGPELAEGERLIIPAAAAQEKTAIRHAPARRAGSRRAPVRRAAAAQPRSKSATTASAKPARKSAPVRRAAARPQPASAATGKNTPVLARSSAPPARSGAAAN